MGRWLFTALFLLLAVGCRGDKSKSGQTRDANPQSKPAVATESARHAASAAIVLDELAALEKDIDVTCWTSFRQLDWFIAEKSYSEFATLAKIAAIKALTRQIWAKASRATASTEVSAADIRAIPLPAIALPAADKANIESFANDIGVKNFQDYQKTTEHWRVVLSVLADEIYLSGGKSPLRPLSREGLHALADGVTTVSLLLLKRSGAAATTAKRDQVEGAHVQSAYKDLRAELDLGSAPRIARKLGAADVTRYLVPITKKLIDGKASALHVFNKGATEVVADLNRISRLPIDKDSVGMIMGNLQSFVHYIAAGYDPMRSDNYLSDGSFESAPMTRKSYLTEIDVQNAIAQIFPHRMLSNGDVLVRFEPNPGPMMTHLKFAPFEIRMLDHEMNGVRDTAIHWIAMKNVHGESPFAMDPFAAEYLSEVASMMVTLWLRRAEKLAAEIGKTEIDVEVTGRVLRGNTFVMVAPETAEATEWGAKQKHAKTRLLSSYPRTLFNQVGKISGLPMTVASSDKTEEAPATFDLQRVMGGGIAVGDINGDGFPDVYMTGEDLGRLYINRSINIPLRFTDVTETWGLPTDIKDGHGSLFFDLEGDGDVDLLVLRSEHSSILFKNTGSRFVDVTKDWGLTTGRGAHVVTAFDYDGDNDLDVYIGYYGSKTAHDSGGTESSLPSLDGRNGSPNQLWRNDGKTFTDVAGNAGVADVGWTLAVSAFDRDNDGDQDLYLASDFGANRFFENRGDGTFADATEATGTGDRGSGMNVDVSDINQDGLWDLYVTNIDMFSKQIKVVFPRDESVIDIDDSLTRAFQYLTGNKLYVSLGDGTYAPQEGLRFEPGDRGWGWDAAFFDYDRDGDDDLYLGNGWIEGSYAGNQKNQMYLQDRGTFYLGKEGSAEAFAGNTRSVAAADFDRDGDVDLLTNQFRQPPRLFENPLTRNRWIRIELKGVGKNTLAIGAQVSIAFDGKTVLRRMTTGRGYLSQADTAIHAGTGTAQSVDLSIRWPDGSQTQHEALATNRAHSITQPDS